MSGKSRMSSDKVSLEMTPMIDVVFQLLIFFIVTLKVEDLVSTLEALRPAPDPAPTQETQQDPITVLVGRQGFFFNGALKTEKQLQDSLSKIAKMNPNSMIMIKCTGDSQHGLLVRALDTCYSLGLRKLSVFSM